MMSFIFFFFQAEDGIRDGRVTGVQTCALPISRCLDDFRIARELDHQRLLGLGVQPGQLRDSVRAIPRRSEEHTSELQSPVHLVCRLLLEKKKINNQITDIISEDKSN